MLSTAYFQFWWELTGCVIERDIQTPILNRPAEFQTIKNVIYNHYNLSRIVQLRIVQLPSNVNNIHETNRQENYKFLLYLDRAMASLVLEGDRVKFRQDELGESKLFIDNNSNDVFVGYISKIITPNAKSMNGSLECYISTNN